MNVQRKVTTNEECVRKENPDYLWNYMTVMTKTNEYRGGNKY